MNFRKSRYLMWIGFAVAIFIMAVGTAFGNDKITGGFVITGTAIFMVALFQAVIFYTCPHCGYSLMNVKGRVPKHCPGCGKEL